MVETLEKEKQSNEKESQEEFNGKMENMIFKEYRCGGY